MTPHAPGIALRDRRDTRWMEMVRMSLAPILVMSCVVLGVMSVIAGEPEVAVLRDGSRVRGSLVDSAGRLDWRLDDGRNLPMASVRWVEGRGGSVVSPRWPLRQVWLRGGGSLTAGWMGSNEKQVRLSLWNNQTLEIPVGALEAFGSLASETELLFDDFGEPRGEWKAEVGRVEIIPLPQESGESALRLTAGTRLSLLVPGRRSDMRLALRYRLPLKPEHLRWKVSLRAAGDPETGPTDVLSVRFEKDENNPRLAGTGLRVDHQELSAADGWRQLTLLTQDGRVQLLIDGYVRAVGRMPAMLIESVSIEADEEGKAPRPGDAAREADRSSVLIDDVHLQGPGPSANEKPAEMRQEPDVDGLRLRSGDSLFGAFERATPTDVAFAAAGHKVLMPWRDVERVTLSARPVSLAPVEGVIARLWLRGPSDRLGASLPGDFLVAAVVASDRESLSVSHPSLGRLSIPHGAVRRIEPRYRGKLQVLDPDVHHFGTAVRGEFRRPLPERTPYELEFETEALGAGEQAVICLATRDVEPCGRDTPPGSPHLAELKAGGLRTDVTLNGVGLGDLNSLLKWKQAGPDDLVVRLTVPAGCLKKGRNTIRLSQRSARRDPDSFDDCEVGPIWIEVGRVD